MVRRYDIRQRRNSDKPFSGDTYELNNLELSMYDLIMGSQIVQKYDLTRKGLDWFRKANPKAYHVLLD